jgi:hypothetical protein
MRLLFVVLFCCSLVFGQEPQDSQDSEGSQLSEESQKNAGDDSDLVMADVFITAQKLKRFLKLARKKGM